MTASHDPLLVVLSVAISLLGAYAARGLSERMREARGRGRLAWLAGGAVVDGTGTWSMHYTDKLGQTLPAPVLFDWPTVLLSWLVGVAGSAAALAVLGRGAVGWRRAAASATLLGVVGISALHFTAVAAMRVPGLRHHYRYPSLVALSVVLAVLVVLLAAALRFRLLDPPALRRWRYHAGPLVRGLANPVAHFTAAAAGVYASTDQEPDLSHAVPAGVLGVLGISVVPVMVLVAALLTTAVGRARARQALLEELFEQAPQAVALLLPDGRVTRVNREFTRVFGYAPGEVVGRRLGEVIVPEEALGDVQRHAELLARGRRVEAEGVRRRKDGGLLNVSIVGVPVSVPDGGVESYVIYRDVTERVRAEGEIRRQKEILQTIFDHSPVMINFIDPAGRFQLVNRHWQEVLGWSAEEARETDVVAELFPDPADRRRVEEFMRDPPPAWTDFRLTRNGRTLDTAWRLMVLSDGTRIGFGLDITEQRQARKALEQSTAQLQALSRRLLEVQEAERRHLARELHDEIGQVLTGLRLLLRPDDGGRADPVNDRLGRARGLVDELLERVRSLSFDLRPAALDQLGLLPALLGLFERYTAQTGVRVEFRHQGLGGRFPPAVETAAYRVAQESLTNAARHAGAAEVTVRAWAGPDLLGVQVEDRGRGFDVEAALAGPHSGGLAGMRERVRLLGGRLTVDSRPGCGSQVTAELPLREGWPEESP